MFGWGKGNILMVIALGIAFVGILLFILEFNALIWGETADENRIGIGLVLIIIGIFLERIASR